MMTHRPRKFLRWAGLAVMIAAAPGMGQGLLSRVNVTPSDSTAGSGALYTIKFRSSLTGTGIPADGKLRITFPPGFTDSAVAAVINDSGLNGGYASIQNVNHVLTLTRDNTGTALAAGDSAQIKLAIVYNSTVADTFRLFIETLTAANVRIDSATSPAFRIIHGPLDHFTINNITTPPVAGVNFNLVMSARDDYENVVKSFAGIVTFTANQGTVIPPTSAAFAQGALTQAVRTDLAGTGRVITATAATGQFGSTNVFTVNPNALHHFAVSNIATPQTAGTGFPVTFTAQDTLNNTVTGFNGTATIGATVGTVGPATSGAFAGGMRAETVTFTQPATSTRITIASAGKAGQSNVFNVNAGALDHFVIAAVGNQIAGQNFSVTVTAQDANNNNIPHSGTVTLSDNTNTLTASPLVFSNQSAVTINNARITRAQNNVVIFASGSGKTAQSSSFTVTHALLDHFRVTNTSDANIGAQTAGTTFAIRVVAQDAFNNTVANFNQTVTITDLTGISVTSASLSGGVLASQNVTVNLTRNDNQLTATGGAPARSGTSNLFNVNPGALNGFTLDMISDQATGAPFSVTMRARDAQNNLKTDFTGTVTISDLTGTIAPAASGTFIGGVRTEGVTITQARTANIISVSGGSPVRSGNSNAFNVQAQTVDHFEISTIGNQTAGVQFNITVTAKDASNNTVTNFTGTVSLSDLSSSIAPATSNNFTAGILTQNFTITKSFTSNRLTVTGLGKTNPSNTFNVAPAALSKFAISTVADQIAGQSFPITITAQDQFDNTVTGFSGAVTISLNSGTITPSTSGAFSAGVRTVSVTIAATGSSRIINVTDGAGHSGNSTSFNVSASGLDHFVFSTIPTQQAGTNFSFTITAKDASGNDVNFNGTVALGDATSTLTPSSVAMNGTVVTVNNARLTKKQDGVFLNVSGGGKSGQSNQFNVIAGPLQRVKVVEGSSGDAPAELATKTLTADQILAVHAAGYDAFGNYTGDQNVNWLVAQITANIGIFDPATNAASTTFYANTTGTGRIVANHASAIDDSSGVITVNPGAGYRVKVLTGTSGNIGEITTLNLTTGQTQDVHAASFDADGNYMQDVSVSWNVTGNIGSLSQNNGVTTRLTASTAGTGVINADHPTLIDGFTGTITVSSGNLFRVRIVEGSSGDGTRFTGRNLTTDGQLTLHAAGYDASNNYLGDYTVTWIARNGIGVVSPAINVSTEFDPQVPGSGRIVANHATALDDSTNLFTVAVGAPVRVKILAGLSGNGSEVNNATLVTGDPPLDMHASSFDRDNNRITDVSVTWELSTPIGTLIPTTGIGTRFTATTAGSGVITANHASLDDDATGTITVQSGNLSYVKVVLGPAGQGSELGNLSRTTDDLVQVHAAGYDAQNNYLGDQTVDWSILGEAIGALNPTNGASTNLTLTRPGAARLVANHVSARDDSSGVITVITGNLHHLTILTGDAGNLLPVDERSVTTDESFTVHAGGFDADNNYKNDVTVNWTITGDPIGGVSPLSGTSTTFNPTKTGRGQIRADHASAGSDLTGIITVNPGQLSYIKVFENPGGQGAELGNKSLSAIQELRLYAAGFDFDGNYIRDEAVNWSSAGTLAPVVTATGVTNFTFQPTLAPANGTIRATHAAAGFDTTGTINITVGPLHRVVVLSGGTGATAPQGDITMNPGQQLTVHAGGFDAENNYRGDEIVGWAVDGSMGTVNNANGLSTVFTAGTIGSGSIRANHPTATVIDGNSGTITVVSGVVARVELRTAANRGGEVFGVYNMTTDSAVTIHAAGYDAGNNFLGDVNVTWSNTGNLSPAVSATGSSLTFSPSLGAANGSVNGTIVGTYTGGVISDATGQITVRPGNPSGTVDLTPNPNSLPANGTATAIVISSVIRDADNNEVGPNRRFTVAVTPPASGEITDPDVDPVTPGKQIQTNAQSRLSFTFRAGIAGGVATIGVNSGLGATGSTTINLGSLSIIQIVAVPSFVTRGQTGASVSMSVQNLGTTPIQALQGGLTFTGTQPRNTDYIVTPAANNPTTIAGNGTVNLNFNVAVGNNAALEMITIDGDISGTVNGTPVNDLGANATDTWQVLRPAQLAVQIVNTAPTTVAGGQNGIAVNVTVANNSGVQFSADAVIDSVRLRFRQGAVDQSIGYAVIPNSNNPGSISGNGTADFSFVVNVRTGAVLGDIVIDAEAYGHDANSGASAHDLNGATTPDSWTVIPGNAFGITQITVSQPSVTANMTRPWTVRMELQNSADSPVNLSLAQDKTLIHFIIGAVDLTSQYGIQHPTALDGGGTVLPGNATGALTFRITQTGLSAGRATIVGFVAGTDGAGQPLSDNTNDSGSGEVTVQMRGTLDISGALQFSQTTITRNQTSPWTITANVTNTGQSAVRYSTDSTRVTVGSDPAFNFSYPTAFLDGDSIIAANEVKALRVTVTRSGNQIGSLPVSLRLKGTDYNNPSGPPIASAPVSTPIESQTPADLVIQQVRASRPSVTAEQTNPWQITLVVRNQGGSTVSVKVDTSTNVRFRIGNAFQSGYASSLVQPSWLGTGSLNLAGNTTDSLRFSVNTTGTAPGLAFIWAKVAATELNSSASRVATNNGSSVTVQTSPNVTYIPNSLTPKTVNNGTQYAFRVRVRNSGTATLDLTATPTPTRFVFGSGVTFSADLDLNKVRSIPPGDTTLTFVGENIPVNMPQTAYAPTLQLRGAHNGNNYSSDVTFASNELRVTAPANLQVISMHSTQTKVTAGMLKPWSIVMTVANNGNSPAQLDSVGLRLLNGGDVTRDFDVVTPSRFLGSNNTNLAAGARDSLRFEIRKTGEKIGGTTVEGYIRVVDLSNNQKLEARSSGNNGSFEVQSRAALNIVSLTPSQQTVTVNQTQVWSVDMLVRNNGGSGVRVSFDQAVTRLTFSPNAGYFMPQPTALVGGGDIIAGNSERTLRFEIAQTGSQVGQNNITGQIGAIEVNSDDPRSDDTQSGGSSFVTVQTAASLRLTSTAIVPASAPNAPRVNIGQPFEVRVEVENRGGEAADSVIVRLSSNGSSTINPPSDKLIPSVSSGSPQSVVFAVMASNQENNGERFTATIISAKAHNTRTTAQQEQPVDNTEDVIVQRRAELAIVSVNPSAAVVPAESNNPWTIPVVLRNNGGAAIALNPPIDDNLTITIDGAQQNDYTIVPPAFLSRNGNLILPGGEIDTLLYRVDNTGRRGGAATIHALIAGKDRNNNLALSAEKNGEVRIETIASVKITFTRPIVNHFFQNSNVGSVNTNQNFAIEVEVENSSLEDVRDVLVELVSSTNSSHIPAQQQTIVSLPQRQQRQIRFEVIAAATPDNQPENFVARVLDATAAISGGRANINRGADTTAQVRIQLPAELALEVNADFNNLTTNQIFELNAEVSNLPNAAEVDQSGRLTLSLPEGSGFTILDPGMEQPFNPGQRVVWRLQAPDSATAGPLAVNMTTVPRDLNSAASAIVAKSADSALVNVVFSNLNISKSVIIDPEGAKDGVVSTGQTFKIESSLAFSKDLAQKKITLTLPSNTGYEFRSGSSATIFDFSAQESWEILVPGAPVDTRSFIIKAEGVTENGTGVPVTNSDTVRVQAVQQATLDFSVKLIKPGQDTTGALTVDQTFTIRATLANQGVAAAVDTATVRLQLGETGVTTTDDLEKKIYISSGSSGVVEWIAQAPPIPTPESILTVQLLNRLNDENSGGPAVWNRGIDNSVINKAVRTDSVGTLFVDQLYIYEPAGAADNTLSTQQEFRVRALIKGRNLTTLRAELVVPAGFSFVNEADRIQRFDSLDVETSRVWQMRAPRNRLSQQQIYVTVTGKDANSGSEVSSISSNLVVDIVESADLFLSASITYPQSVALDNVASIGQPFEITAILENRGEADTVGAGSINLVLPAGYTTAEPLAKTTINSQARWQVTARNTPSVVAEVITLTLNKPYPNDRNTGDEAPASVVERTLNIRTEETILTVTDISASQGIKAGPVISQQKGIPVLALDWRNEGNEGSSNIVMKTLKFYVVNSQNQDLPPNAAVARVQVVAGDDPNKVLGQLTEIPNTNPLTLNFAIIDTVFGGASKQATILVDVANAATADDFFLTVRSGNDIIAENADSPSKQVQVNLAGGTITSVAAVLSSANYEDSFYNYPNPFSTVRNGRTTFNYSLPQDSEVDFRIFTLLGELVYTKSFKSTDPQGKAGARTNGVSQGFIEWDGRNGNGDLVFNGVYMAVLKTSAGTVTTKVAVVK